MTTMKSARKAARKRTTKARKRVQVRYQKPGDEVSLLFRNGIFIAAFYDHDGIGMDALCNYVAELTGEYDIDWQDFPSAILGFPNASASTWGEFTMLFLGGFDVFEVWEDELEDDALVGAIAG